MMSTHQDGSLTQLNYWRAELRRCLLVAEESSLLREQQHNRYARDQPADLKGPIWVHEGVAHRLILPLAQRPMGLLACCCPDMKVCLYIFSFFACRFVQYLHDEGNQDAPARWGGIQKKRSKKISFPK